ncbi:glycine-rich domain-containing protein [Tomitella gaofuii]|uniref:glycine-rich domain-containing protein n=1 Tax=Tomitella gaofuii TaxID=2760083 RepID=UPI0015FB1D8E|nr:hypothetical protein [Tomitella gaofuii]
MPMMIDGKTLTAMRQDGVEVGQARVWHPDGQWFRVFRKPQEPRFLVVNHTITGVAYRDVPAWADYVAFYVWGGGGGGSGGDGGGFRTGTGGAAGQARGLGPLSLVTYPLRRLAMMAGAYGAGGAKESSGKAGGDSGVQATLDGNTWEVYLTAKGGAGGSGYNGTAGGTADSLRLRNGEMITGGKGGSNNQAGTAPGGGGGAGTGGVFGNANPGKPGGRGRVAVAFWNEDWQAVN